MRVFSSARRFSNPMSHAIPDGSPGEGDSESLTMGMRACGNVLTVNLVSSLESVEEVDEEEEITGKGKEKMVV